ncbi:MAG: polyprenyl synthetase family protein [Pyrinomonadaceae bacterium]|nr:polyprenyl synthetase family protein [Pyrinomonadaceae bacterium]MCX7639935.1 polyprenyl synthetase family protein [Pyrinomonadaceae bacterium]MDW8304107.1 polyprenyl synthetase family protein [Acidobacteriota bacterium]
MSELGKFWSRVGHLVDCELDRLLPQENVEPVRLHAAVRWSVFAGGKRFRPALLIAVGSILGAEEKKLLRTAAAVEMIHTYSLIHDDLPAMDNDQIRRGRATCHVKFDEATAILAGDLLQVLAFSAIADDENLNADIKIKLISELSKAASQMARGQQLDLESEKKKISFAELEEIHKNKTGAMICFSVRAGAIIAGASDKQMRTLTEFASLLGLLFQITDDLLDVTQSTEKLGKTAGKDLIAEKATYPSFYGIERTKQLAREVYLNSIRTLEEIPKDTSLLKEFAEFILSRDR